jgi:hypothetical protein
MLEPGDYDFDPSKMFEFRVHQQPQLPTQYGRFSAQTDDTTFSIRNGAGQDRFAQTRTNRM